MHNNYIRYKKIQNEKLKQFSLSEKAKQYILDCGLMIDCPDFSGLVAKIINNIGIAVTTVGKWDLFIMYKGKKLKKFKQQTFNKYIDRVEKLNFICIEPFEEFTKQLKFNLVAERTEISDTILFDDTYYDILKECISNGQEGF